MRIKLILAILSPRPSDIFEKFDHPFSHVFIFGNVFPESHGFVAMPVTTASQIHTLYVAIYPYLISEGRRNCSSL